MNLKALKIHISGVTGHQLAEKVLLLLAVSTIGQDNSILGGYLSLDMVGFAIHDPYKGLLDGNCSLQHGFHDSVVSSIPNAADI